MPISASARPFSPKQLSLFCQVGVLLLVWIYLVCLHGDNDGLWYQGDAPRHAANGLFWKDFLSRLPVNPLEFAVSYYLRYPVISPSAYPPGFYLLEAVAFSLFGVSPLIAKILVLLFALVAGVYAIAWLRRWVAEAAGWGGSLLLLQPGVIGWSHAVMLNIPSMALSLAALYHARRWLDAPESRHLYAALAFAAFGILTYVHSAVVLPVVLAWIATEQRWAILRARRLWVIGMAVAALVIPWAMVAARWAPVHLSLLYSSDYDIFSANKFTFYARHLPSLFHGSVLVLSLIGACSAAVVSPLRREATLLVSWTAVCYVVLSFIMAQDPRYGLLMLPPLLLLAGMGLVALAQWTAVLARRNESAILSGGWAVLIAAHLWAAPAVTTPAVSGFQDVVSFLEQQAPHERIFYDGQFNGIFSFYLRAGDPDFQRGVVRGNKLLYPSAIDAKWHLTERVSSPAEVVALLRQECGCQWLVIERPIAAAIQRVKAWHHLREALKSPAFQFVRSFPIRYIKGPPADGHADDFYLDVYRLLHPGQTPKELQFSMPILGAGAVIKGKPVER